MNFFPVANPTIRFGVRQRGSFIPFTADTTLYRADKTTKRADQTADN